MRDALLITLAEAWGWRRTVGIPALVGAVLAAVWLWLTPPLYSGRVMLQLQADAARAPLLQAISAPGHRQVLWAALTGPDVLRDSAPGATPPLTPNRIELRILNNYLLEVGVNATQPQGLALITENLGYNFIQAILAPERIRVEQLLNEAQSQLTELDALPQPLDATTQTQRERAVAAVAQLQSDLRLLNNAFGQQGGQALIWFADAARVTEPLQGLPRWLLALGLGALFGGLVGYGAHRLPRRWHPAIHTIAEAQAASGLPVVGVLPWLNQLAVTHQGSRVNAGGKALAPTDFAEMTRLGRSILRNLRGPLLVVSPSGAEGASSVALLLAEKAAADGKPTILADLNLKNRSLSEKMLLGDGSWILPHGKGAWGALRPIAGNLQALPAPKQMAALQGLAEQGGIPSLLEAMQKHAEVVVLDASPLTAANRGNLDAVTLGTHANRTILVAQQGITQASQLKLAADQLLLAGVNVQGVVLNQQFAPTRRQRLSQLAEALGWLSPALGRALSHAAQRASLD